MSISTLDSVRQKQRAAARKAQRNQRIRVERIQALNNPKAVEMPPAAVSVVEYRRLTGLSHASVHRRIRDGGIASVKVGGRRLIPWSEVERLRGE